jgi:hypothetical protein
LRERAREEIGGPVHLTDLREGSRVRPARSTDVVLVYEVVIVDPVRASPVLITALWQAGTNGRRLPDARTLWCKPDDLEPADPVS